MVPGITIFLEGTCQKYPALPLNRTTDACETRMHSSRMRTDRGSSHLGVGVPWGVWAEGVSGLGVGGCLVWVGVWSEGMSGQGWVSGREVSGQRRTPPGRRSGGRPPPRNDLRKETPVNRQTPVKILPSPILRMRSVIITFPNFVGGQ